MLDPTTIPLNERELIKACLSTSISHLNATLISPVSSFAGATPPALSGSLNTLTALISVIDRLSLHAGHPKVVSEKDKRLFAENLPLLKRAVIQRRRQIAQQVQERTAQTLDAE